MLLHVHTFLTQISKMEPIITEIDSIGNYYGCLSVKKENGRFFWGIENYHGTNWEEIPESLYIEILSFKNSKL